MVWHHHIRIVNLFEGTQRLEHIHIAFVRKDLDKIEETALDVAEVDVKQLLPLTESSGEYRRDLAPDFPAIPTPSQCRNSAHGKGSRACGQIS